MHHVSSGIMMAAENPPPDGGGGPQRGVAQSCAGQRSQAAAIDLPASSLLPAKLSRCLLLACRRVLTEVGRHVEAHNSAQLAGQNGLAQAQEGRDAPVVFGHAPQRCRLQAKWGGAGGAWVVLGVRRCVHLSSLAPLEERGNRWGYCSRRQPGDLKSTYAPLMAEHLQEQERFCVHQLRSATKQRPKSSCARCGSTTKCPSCSQA